MRQEYLDKKAELSIPAGIRIYCHKPSCSAWIPQKNISKSCKYGSCPKCSRHTCTRCRTEFHNGHCPQYHDLASPSMTDLAEKAGWRRCYNCGITVEHTEGCRHMHCRCGANFCYCCGMALGTCSCTEADLAEGKLAGAKHLGEPSRARSTTLTREMEENIRMVQEHIFQESRRRALQRRREEEEARRREERLRFAARERRRAAENEYREEMQRVNRLIKENQRLYKAQRKLIANSHNIEAERRKIDRHNKLTQIFRRQLDETNAVAANYHLRESHLKTQFIALFAERELSRTADTRNTTNFPLNVEGDLNTGQTVEATREQAIAEHLRATLELLNEKKARELLDLGDTHKQKVLEARNNFKDKKDEFDKQKYADFRWLEAVQSERVSMLRALFPLPLPPRTELEQGDHQENSSVLELEAMPEEYRESRGMSEHYERLSDASGYFGNY